MTRPKTQSDNQVLDFALALLRDRGVGGLTFAALADRCGLSTATLVQRFTNKVALTQRTLLHAWDQLDALTLYLAANTPRTPDGAVQLLIGLSQQYGGADSYGDGLLVLREDIRDPALRSRGVAWETTLTAILDECFIAVSHVQTGIGFALAAFWQGSLTWWAFHADQPLDEYLEAKLTEFISMVSRE